MICKSRYSIHDLSGRQRREDLLILDSVKNRYKKTMCDASGQTRTAAYRGVYMRGDSRATVRSSAFLTHFTNRSPATKTTPSIFATRRIPAV